MQKMRAETGGWPNDDSIFQRMQILFFAFVSLICQVVDAEFWPTWKCGWVSSAHCCPTGHLTRFLLPQREVRC